MGNVCLDGCPIIFDATCAEYTGVALTNIEVNPYDTVHQILETLNDILDFDRTAFSANSNNTIIAAGGGIEGHSPTYSVRIDGSATNAITSSSAGISVVASAGGDGKVKTDESDTRDYLETKFATETDGIVILTVTPVKVSGKMQFVPTLAVDTLLEQIRIYHSIQFCEIISDCIPHSINS